MCGGARASAVRGLECDGSAVLLFVFFRSAREKENDVNRVRVRQFVCLFGEGTHARSVVAEASGMAQKIVARTLLRRRGTLMKFTHRRVYVW